MGFSDGLEAGFNYAQQQSALDLKKQHLDLQAKEQDEQKRQFNVQRSDKALSLVERIVMTPEGKYRKALVGNVKTQLDQLGLPMHELTEAALNDPASAGDVKRAIDSMRSLRAKGALTDDQFAQAASILPTESFLDSIKNFNEHSEKIDQLHTQGVEARKTAAQEDVAKMERLRVETGSHEKVSGQKIEAENLKERRENIKKTADAVESISKQFSRVTHAGKDIRNVFVQGKDDKGKPILDFDKQGIDDIFVLKTFNQFSDTPAVREGEVKFIQSASGWFDDAARMLENLSQNKGAKLTPEVRKQIYDRTQQIVAENLRLEADRVNPYVEQMRKQGADPKEYLSPHHIRMIIDKGQDPQAASDLEASTRAQQARNQSIATTIQSMTPENRQIVAKLRATAKQRGVSIDDLVARAKTRGKALPQEIIDVLKLGGR